MNFKMTVLLVLAVAVAVASAAPKPGTVYTSPLTAVTYTRGIAYHAPAAIYPVYPVVDANGQVVKDQNCPGCPPELSEGLAASYVTATPAYYI